MNKAWQTDRFRKRLYRYLLVFVAMVVLAAAAPFSGLLLQNAVAEQGFANGNNPRAEYWRAVRQGDTGVTTVKGKETGVLIQNGGENWRQLRNGPLANYGGWILALVLAALAAFYLIVGRMKLAEGKSGRTVTRWSAAERTLHWFTAVSFILLGITGLSLLFGRALLIPVIGKEAFAAYAALAKDIHNYLGPLFIVSLVLFLLKLLPHNLFNKTDIEWFKQGGGMVGGRHPSAGRMNGGEKVWFWSLCTVGVALMVTGALLDFPVFGLDREGAQLAQLIHGATAVVVIALAFGHIYIGTIGTEGALQGMVSGEVDVNWAKQHHDLWYAEVKGQAGTDPASASGISGSQASPKPG